MYVLYDPPNHLTYTYSNYLVKNRNYTVSPPACYFQPLFNKYSTQNNRQIYVCVCVCVRACVCVYTLISIFSDGEKQSVINEVVIALHQINVHSIC
jgi:hypothetical protein